MVVQMSNTDKIEGLNKESMTKNSGVTLRSQTVSSLEIDERCEKKPVLNARKGISKMLADIIFGNSSSKNLKKGSVGYLIDKIQKILRLISLLFSLIIIIFLISSRINKGKKEISSNFPIGSLSRSLKFDLMLDSMDRSNNAPIEDINDNILEEEFHSELIDNPDYWADEDDRDLWEDDKDEYYDMDIINSEELEKEEISKEVDDKKEFKRIIGERNKGLRSKGVQVSLPSSLTLYGRINSKDSYINGVYNIILEDSKDKTYPKLRHGRAIYIKENVGINKNNQEDFIPTLYIIFDGRYEFWTINTSMNLNSKPLAFLPDHGLIPIRHVGPYGAHSNSSWFFRENSTVVKDRSVRIVENSSINNPRIPVYITKATHNWHIKHHNENKNKESSHKYDQIGREKKVYIDPYTSK